MKRGIPLLVVALLSFAAGASLAQPFTPAEYFPLAVGNHWTYFNQSYPGNDERWMFLDIVGDTIFGIPNETKSFRMEFSENIVGNPDTSMYHAEYYTYTSNGELAWVAATDEDDSLIVFDTAFVFLRNPVNVGDICSLIQGTVQITATVISLTDTLSQTIGQFQDVLNLHFVGVYNGELMENNFRYYLPSTYWPDWGGMGRIAEWDSMGQYLTDELRLVECNFEPGSPPGVFPIFSPCLETFTLDQNYPNPFNSATGIHYQLLHPGIARLVIFDALGREVRSFQSDYRTRGEYSVYWDGRDRRGNLSASGRYYYVLSAGQVSVTRQMVLLK